MNTPPTLSSGCLHTLALRLAELAKRGHDGCDDKWYSCPKHEDGCSNPNAGTECNCGADAINSEVEDILRALSQNDKLSHKEGEK